MWVKVKWELGERISKHRNYIHRKETNQTTGDHFNKPGHSISNMKITILEKVKSTDPIYRKERKKYHIRKLNTFNNGINKNLGLGSVSKTLTNNLLYCQYIPDNQEEKSHIKNSSKASPGDMCKYLYNRSGRDTTNAIFLNGNFCPKLMFFFFQIYRVLVYLSSVVKLPHFF